MRAKDGIIIGDVVQWRKVSVASENREVCPENRRQAQKENDIEIETEMEGRRACTGRQLQPFLLERRGLPSSEVGVEARHRRARIAPLKMACPATVSRQGIAKSERVKVVKVAAAINFRGVISASKGDHECSSIRIIVNLPGRHDQRALHVHV